MSYNLHQAFVIRRCEDLLKRFRLGDAVELNAAVLRSQSNKNREGCSIFLIDSELDGAQRSERGRMEEPVFLFALVDKGTHQIWTEQRRHSPIWHTGDHATQQLEAPGFTFVGR
jgi:hypothetical protein